MRHRASSAVSARVWLLSAALSVVACAPPTSDRPSASSTAAASASTAESTGRATTAPSSPRQEGDIVVLERDAGTHVRLHPGQQLSIELGADFRSVSVSDEGVLKPHVLTGGYPTGQPLMAVLTAVSPGEVLLTSSTDVACLHEPMPCAVPQQEWQLSVTVAAD
jgi:hypothetical protein